MGRARRRQAEGLRNSGHRTDDLDARRAADAYSDKWLGAAALKPDLGRLAEASAPSKPRKAKAAPKPPPDSGAAERRNSIDLSAANAKVEDLQRKLEGAEARATKAEERASAAEAKAAETEGCAKERMARMRAALGE